MPKIFIVFKEEGKPQTSVEISEEISEILDKHIEYLNSEGVNVSGKTELFVKMTWENWLKPILERQGKSIIELAGDIGQEYLKYIENIEIKRKLVEQAAINNVIKIEEREKYEN